MVFASDRMHHAKTAGPLPDNEQPNAEFFIAACRTSAKPGMPDERCGSMSTSRKERDNKSISPE